MNDWVIYVHGYGAFMFEGDETEAEKMRAHKANWEGGIGKKRLATDEEHRSRKPSECINHPGFKNRGVYADCGCGACSAQQKEIVK
jgi:hypothetical protein